MSEKETNSFWNYHPELPLKFAPYYQRPFRLKQSLLHYLRSWYPLHTQFLFLPLAILVWLFFTPSLERAENFSVDWIAEIWLRNLILITVVAGGLHLWLHTYGKQGKSDKYDKLELGEKHARFLFGDQLKDNVFLSLGSAVLVWTLYESLMLWAFANGFATLINFETNPIWFVLMILFVPFWAEVFFDMQHRVMHREPLYKHIHSWHHKNANTGHWSGLAMHPIEHIVLMADTLIYFILAAHPIHIIYNLLFHGLGAPTSHVGFERVKIGRWFYIHMGDFYHQIHHRFFDINFGSRGSPFDLWSDTYHDGTTASHKEFMQKRKVIRRARASQ